MPHSTRAPQPPEPPPDAPRPTPISYPSDTFITIAQLAADSTRLIPYLARRCQAIVGIARSGMIPAAILATQLHLPLYSVHAGRVTHAGHGIRLEPGNTHAPRVAIVDDTAASGYAMRNTWPAVAAAFGTKPLTVTVYTTPLAQPQLDYWAAELPGNHFLEWNLWNAGHFTQAATDFDGILCQEIDPRDDDDGPRYAAAIAAALPKYLPRRKPIPLIITSRLERWRNATDQWLRLHGIQYQKLSMGPWKSIDERNQDWPLRVSMRKAEQYSHSRCTLFLESDPQQAHHIANFTAKPVLCPALPRILHRR